MQLIYSRSKTSAFVLDREPHERADEQIYVTNLESGETAVLSSSAGVIWQLLETPHTAESLIAEVAAEYGASEETVEAGVREFLQSLQQQGLVEVASESL